MQNTTPIKPWVVLTLFTLAIICALAAGLLQRQLTFDTRGIFSVGDPINEKHNGAELGLVVSLEQYDSAQLDENLTQITDRKSVG